MFELYRHLFLIACSSFVVSVAEKSSAEGSDPAPHNRPTRPLQMDYG